MACNIIHNIVEDGYYVNIGDPNINMFERSIKKDRYYKHHDEERKKGFVLYLANTKKRRAAKKAWDNSVRS
jgi:hypothetical protein